MNGRYVETTEELCLKLRQMKLSASYNVSGPINMICWSGCPDNTYSYGSSSGGQFTNTLRKYFNKDRVRTNAESLITFMALNKMGIIVNFVHPLLPPESVEEILDFTDSKGIMMLDMFAPKYAPMLKKVGLPVVLCSPKEYAMPDKTACTIDEEALRSLSTGGLTVYQYPQILKRYAGQHVNSIPEGRGYIAVYMNGGGTTGKSHTIKLSNYALNSVIYGLGAVNIPVQKIGYDTSFCRSSTPTSLSHLSRNIMSPSSTACRICIKSSLSIPVSICPN